MVRCQFFWFNLSNARSISVPPFLAKSCPQTESNRVNFGPSFSLICDDDFCGGGEQWFFCGFPPPIEGFCAIRDCNNAKTIGSSKDVVLSRQEKSFLGIRGGGFEEDEKWTAVDPDGVEALEHSLIKWSEKTLHTADIPLSWAGISTF